MKDEVCCIIVTYNIGKKFNKYINSIINQVKEIIIIDNNSDEETREVLRKLSKYKNIEVIFNKDNFGIAKALNQGVEYAIKNEYKWILTLDDDSLVTDNMIVNLLTAYRQAIKEFPNEDIVSIFPTIVEEKKYNKLQEIGTLYNFVDVGITSGNLLNTKVFEKVGYFNEHYFIDQVDFEFCLRLKKDNLKLIRVNNAVLLHNYGDIKTKKIFGISVSYTNHNYLRRYYSIRNRLDLWSKYKKVAPEFIKKDKKYFIKDIVKVTLFEEDKIKKIIYTIKGVIDYKKGKIGSEKVARRKYKNII